MHHAALEIKRGGDYKSHNQPQNTMNCFVFKKVFFKNQKAVLIIS